MSAEVAEILDRVKSMSHEQVSDLAYQLFRVFDSHEPQTEQSDVDASWKVELRRRIDDIESGRVELVDGRETIAMARAMLSSRRA